MLKDAGISIRLVRPLAARLRAVGADLGAMLAEVGIDPATVFDSEARLAYTVAFDVWRQAEVVTGDPDLGLHTAEVVDFGLFERIDYETEYLVFQLLATSDTVGEGLARFVRHYVLSDTTGRMMIEQANGLAHIRYWPPAEPLPPRGWIELTVALLVRAVRDMALHPVVPIEISFAHPIPESTGEHRRVLGTVPRFGAGENGFVLAEDQMAEPLRNPRAALLKVLEGRAGELLARLTPAASLAERARALIAAELCGGNTNAERIAQNLGLSVRNLARKLSDLGTSHRALLTEVRIDLARRHLRDERLSTADIAEVLGFSEPSAFQRAFKRWFGQSPADYRRVQQRRG